MARFSFFALLALAAFGAAAPVARRASDDDSCSSSSSTKSSKGSSASSSAAAQSTAQSAASTGSFTLLDYADFQISDGVAGDAEAEANAVFVDPFANVDLATIDDQTVDDIQTMREAAEDAETDQFNPEIESASGDDADALQVGKIKNKVLKLTGETMVLKIKIAQAEAAGDDTSDLESKLAEEQKKLDTNIATDQKSAGATSQSVV
ncbi:hypothetical protein BD626DRAFT_563444 [Schizophyllum amplum]|uniref:Small secreted protein n=1 Tax=Schizophyllum amplum TaxID=97359 RepID=A0A550CY40_9AGAR|nr:hypothetical protein BD626DRAFT_563444 [Auriculariopsis ampla]